MKKGFIILLMFSSVFIQKCYGQVSSIWGIAASHSGKILAVGYNPRNVEIFSTDNLNKYKTIITQTGVVYNGLQFSNNDSVLFIATQGYYIDMLEFPSTNLIKRLGPLSYESPNQILLSPDNKMLAIYTDMRRIRIWDVNSNQLIFTLNDKTVNYRFQFSEDNKYFIYGSTSNGSKVYIRDLNKFEILDSISASGSGTGVYAFKNNKIVLSDNLGQIFVYDFKSKIKIGEMKSDEVIYAMCLNDNNNIVATVGKDKKLVFWDINKYEIIQKIDLSPTIGEFSVNIPGMNKIVVAGDPDNILKLYNYPKINRVQEISEPSNFTLSQNHPNPFNPSTVISYQLPVNSFVAIKIYNLLGQEIESLINKQQQAGNYSVNWSPKNLTSGIYYYKLVVSGSNPLQTDKFVEMKKMIFIK